ncbi:hypothetical protein [Leptolyngbya ohadii]|uniref:hypothetical protein n=1 Tax=Leptolyngbya ohadii TaxID=1962290 RepID=UPI000B5A0EDF|nr:hypothetical protein [Leptolyngbya ohadii]
MIASPPRKNALQLPIFPATPAAAPSPTWAIERVPNGVALGSDRFWLVCGSWHYCLQFQADEADLLAALLARWDWLNWELDDRGCPACVEILHGAIEQLVSAGREAASC